LQAASWIALFVAENLATLGIIAGIAALVAAIVFLATHWHRVWTDIKNWAKDAWEFITHGWAQWLFPELTLIRKAVEIVRDHWKGAWNDIKNAAEDVGRWLWTDFGAKIENFLVRTLPGFFTTAVNGIRRAWQDVQNAVLGPVNWVIRYVINDGLIKAFDWVSSAVGGPHINPIGAIGGGGGGGSGGGPGTAGYTGPPGGLGRHARGGRLPGYGGGDRRLALLEDGETIIDKHRASLYAPLFAAMGIPGYQHGGRAGPPPTGPNPFSGLFSKGKALAGIFAAIATGNGTALTNDFVKLFGGGVGGAVGDMAGLLLAIPRALVRSIVHSLLGFGGAAAAHLGGGVSGNVKSYAPLVLQVLKMLGQPAGDLGVALTQMNTESGGQPDVVNKWDSNWVAGHPSVGLMQVIAGTFARWAGPFRNVGPFLYGVSTNPLANIFAGLNYAVHTYPDWTAVLGHGHGYDRGGWLQPGFAWNATGRREAVLTPAQSEAFVAVGEAARKFGKGQGGLGSGMLMRDVYLTLPEGTTVAAALQEISFRLRLASLQGALP
jgi:hypothetical protein